MANSITLLTGFPYRIPCICYGYILIPIGSTGICIYMVDVQRGVLALRISWEYSTPMIVDVIAPGESMKWKWAIT